MEWIAGAAFLLLAVFLSPLLEGPVERLQSKILGPFWRPQRHDLSGRWVAQFDVVVEESPAESRPFTEGEELTIRQVGRLVLALTAGRSGYVRLRGRLKNSFLTGIWTDQEDGRQHQGAFQLFLHPKGDRMTGKFVGFDSKNRVNWGHWAWKRVLEDDRHSRSST